MMLLEIAAILFVGINKIPPELIVFRNILTNCFLRNMDLLYDPLLLLQWKMTVTSLPHSIFREINTLKPFLDPSVYTQKFNDTFLNFQRIQHIKVHVFLDDGT